MVAPPRPKPISYLTGEIRVGANYYHSGIWLYASDHEYGYSLVAHFTPEQARELAAQLLEAAR